MMKLITQVTMKYLPFFISALFALWYGCNQASAFNKDDSGRNAYAFETSLRKNDKGKYDALILNCKSGEKSQSFAFSLDKRNGKEYMVTEETGKISEADINADGYPDVVVCLGDFGIILHKFHYGACVWNEGSQQFDLVEVYSDIPNAKPCYGKNKRLVIGSLEAPDGYSYEDCYDWEEGNLVYIYSDETFEKTLPEEFEWAYGWWKVTENSGTEDERTYDIIIRGDSYQSNEGYIRFGYAEEGFYPVYTMPCIPFSVDDSKEIKAFFDLQDEDLVLSTSSIGDYEYYIILRQKAKTIGVDTKCVRVQKERDIDVIVDYKRKLASIPIQGQWEAIKPVSGDMAEYVNAVEVDPDNTYLLTQKGNIIELGSGNLLSYDKAKDRLTINYAGFEEGESTFTYKRQPRE